MEQRCNTQYWLENSLKKLYKRVETLNSKVNKRRRKKKRICRPPPPCVPKREPPKQEEQDNPLEKEFESERKKFWNFVDEFLLSRTAYARSKKHFHNLRKKPSFVNYVVWKSIKNSLTLPSTLICPPAANQVVPQDAEGENSLTMPSTLIGQSSQPSSSNQIVPQDAEEGTSMALRSRTVHREDNPTTSKRIVKRKPGNSMNLRSRVVCRPSDKEEKSSEKVPVKKKLDPAEQEKVLAQRILLGIQRARIKKSTDVIFKEFKMELKAKKKNNLSSHPFF